MACVGCVEKALEEGGVRTIACNGMGVRVEVDACVLLKGWRGSNDDACTASGGIDEDREFIGAAAHVRKSVRVPTSSGTHEGRQRGRRMRGVEAQSSDDVLRWSSTEGARAECVVMLTGEDTVLDCGVVLWRDNIGDCVYEQSSRQTQRALVALLSCSIIVNAIFRRPSDLEASVISSIVEGGDGVEISPVRRASRDGSELDATVRACADVAFVPKISKGRNTALSTATLEPVAFEVKKIDYLILRAGSARLNRVAQRYVIGRIVKSSEKSPSGEIRGWCTV
jgi:hypothetical protein